MVNVYYDVICRDCTAYVSTRHLSTLKIENPNSETDYDLSKKIKELRGKDFPCNRCGSLNSEVINIKCEGVNFFDKPISDYYKDENRLFLSISIEKTLFSEPVFKVETSELSSDLKVRFIEKIIAVFIARRGDNPYKTNAYGHFDIICSVKELNAEGTYGFRIDKLVICGFSKDVFLLLLNKLKENIQNKKQI